LNERLYTISGTEARDLFDEKPDNFAVYHQGYRSQVSKWPQNPVDIFIEELKSQSPDLVVADFGCGDAKLASSVPQKKVHSFDLVAVNDKVTACDMAHVPLSNGTADVVVFCLSLMGTNTQDFIKEARRILKKGGTLHVAEVKSRISSSDIFVRFMSVFGFKITTRDESNKMFSRFSFLLENKLNVSLHKLPLFSFRACQYKRR